MRSPVLLGIALALLLVGIGCMWWYMGQKPIEAPTQATTTRALPRDSGATIVLTTKTGKVVTVPDFTYGHPSVEVEDTGVTYVYVTQDDSLTELDPVYGIVYGSDSSIVMGLFAEPLADARLRAEAKLKELLPIPEPILCEMNIVVNAADTINPVHVGRNLGLSFCAGATAL